jgi:hypothetical protein
MYWAKHDAVLVLPRRGSLPPRQSPGVLLDKVCRPAPAVACTMVGRTPHAQDRQAEDNTSSARLFGCGTYSSSLVPLLCSERSSLHLLANILVAALCSHLRFYQSVMHHSHYCVTGNCFAHTKQSQPSGRIETGLVAEIYFPSEKLLSPTFRS